MLAEVKTGYQKNRSFNAIGEKAAEKQCKNELKKKNGF